jgi:hypothetical protein
MMMMMMMILVMMKKNKETTTIPRFIWHWKAHGRFADPSVS